MIPLAQIAIGAALLIGWTLCVYPLVASSPSNAAWLLAAVLGVPLLAGPRLVRQWLNAAGERLFASAEPEPTLALSDRRRAQWVGLALVLAGLAFLEWLENFYFTQDDNLVQLLPLLLQGGRSFFDGDFPTWNPYQLLGQPLANLGVYSLTYPPLYLSYAVSRFLLRNEYLTLEVYAWLHFTLGYLFMFRLLLRYWRTPFWIAVAVATSFVFSGFFLQAGRSWYFMLPLTLWIPLGFTAWLGFLEKPDLKHALLCGGTLGAYFHAGNAQMWSYLLLFVSTGGALSLLHGEARARRAGLLALVISTAILVAAPLLIAQMSYVADVPRGPWGGGIRKGLVALLIPYPFFSAPHPNGWGNEFPETMTELYFCGPLLVAAALGFVLLYTYRVLSRNLSTRTGEPSLQIAWGVLLAFSLALGHGSPASDALSTLPGFNKFSNPFKFLAFLSFFVACAGAATFRGIASLFPEARSRKIGWGIAAVLLCLVANHLCWSRGAFYHYDARPYPELTALRAALQGAQRVVNDYPARSTAMGYLHSLPHNTATVYRILSFSGYEPLVSQKPESAVVNDETALRDYGVSHVLLTHGSGDRDIASGLDVDILLLKDPAPIVGIPASDGAIEEIELRGNGVRFKARATAPTVATVAFVWRQGFVARVDGARSPLEKDERSRMRVALPPGEHRVELEYYPIWRAGYLLVALLTALLSACFYLLWRGTDAPRDFTTMRSVV